jgi:predicted AlkP superfamily pyrophosphatase or phosphodiesterase
MKSITNVLIGWTFLLLITACSHLPVTDSLPLILISLDGFRPDYLNQEGAGNLRALAARGIRAEELHPSFPTTTFPNHYTIVTGLRPDHHGVVGNTMEAPSLPGEHFSSSDQTSLIDHRWWDQAEPIWVTAEKHQIRTAVMFWPGSEAAVHGVRPSDYRPFNASVTADQRVDTVLGWFDRPATSRPGLVLLYLNDVDSAGHASGPDSVSLAESVTRADAALGRLTLGLRARGIAANIVVVSDHGMAATSPQRLIRFNRIAPPASYRLVVNGPYAGVEAQPGKETALEEALLKPQDHMQCWKKGDLPARLHYGQNARVPSFICIAEVGWFIVPGAENDKLPKGGTHGYDNMAWQMQAIFIAAGPAFKQGVVLPAFDNVDIYPLLMKLLNITPVESDGTLAPIVPGLETGHPERRPGGY